MTVSILVGDCRTLLRDLPAGSFHMCVSSPPYFGLRDYDVDGQIGLEHTPEAYVAELVSVFRHVHRVLRDDGTLWLNLGDSYANDTKWGGSTSGKHVRAQHGDSGIGRRRHKTGLKSKDLIGIPWRVAFALQADGWYLRQDIIWSKPNPMPESVRDRCTKAHEYLFLLSKGPRYYYDADAIAEGLAEASVARLAQNVQAQSGSDRVPGKTNGRMKAVSRKNSFARDTKDSGGVTGDKPQFRASREPVAYEGVRNKRSVWTVATQPFKEAHFATYPPKLIEPCIMAGSPAGGSVLDPFGGAGTTGMVAARLGRSCTMIELNPTSAAIADRRLRAALCAVKTPPAPVEFGPLFGGEAA